jgi:4,5-dihydroxyphthalate decarboxylase
MTENPAATPAADVTVVVGNYPHTKLLKSHDTVAGVEIAQPYIEPVHDAFDDMLRSQPYQVCEMAIAAALQALDAGKPVRLLPVVLAGNYQHRNLYASPAGDVTDASQLKGRKVGVKSFSQTTGLWVRGWLEEEFGVKAGEMDWMVTEPSHLEEFKDPDFVHPLEGKLAAALTAGTVDAAILGRTSAPAGLGPLVSDYAERDQAWYDTHGFAPINHMLLVTEQMLAEHPEVVTGVYDLIAAGIDERVAAEPTTNTGLPTPFRHGLAAVRGAVELAAKYAYDQGLVTKPVADVDALFAFDGKVG